MAVQTAGEKELTGEDCAEGRSLWEQQTGMDVCAAGGLRLWQQVRHLPLTGRKEVSVCR